MDTTPTKFELPFVRKEMVAKDTYTFYFDRTQVKYDFLAGQYNRVNLPIENPDERGSSRYFTVSSSPTDLTFLTITTKIIQSSFKHRLNSLAPGEKMTFFGPLGTMYQSESDLTPKIFLAGGIGITPAHSMLRFMDAKKLSLDFTLFVSFSFKEEVIFYDELKEIEEHNSNVKTVFTLTKEENLYSGFEKGRIDDKMIKKYVQGYKSSRFLITGPPAMVQAMFETISAMGILEENIKTENFTGY